MTRIRSRVPAQIEPTELPAHWLQGLPLFAGIEDPKEYLVFRASLETPSFRTLSESETRRELPIVRYVPLPCLGKPLLDSEPLNTYTDAST